MSANPIESMIARLALRSRQPRDGAEAAGDGSGPGVILRLVSTLPPGELERLRQELRIAAAHARLALRHAVSEPERKAAILSIDQALDALRGVLLELAKHGPAVLARSAPGEPSADLKLLFGAIESEAQALVALRTALAEPAPPAPSLPPEDGWPGESPPPAEPEEAAEAAANSTETVPLARLLKQAPARPPEPPVPPPAEPAAPSPSEIAARIAAMAAEREARNHRTALGRLLRAFKDKDKGEDKP